MKRKTIFQLQNIVCSYELIATGAPKTQLWDNLLGDVKTPLQMSRIDYFQISDDLQYAVKSCEFLCPLSSEHLPVKITLHLQSFKTRRRGYWKFNRSFLENRQFICDFKCKINDTVSNFNEFDDARVNWEHLKFKMREFSRNESIKIAKLRKINRENLEEKVKTFAGIDDQSESDLEEYENAKAELEKIYDHSAEGIILRSKSQWYEEGEKASKYFLTFEKSRKAKTCIRKINYEEHGETCDPKIIMSELKMFYQNLYRKWSVKTEKECPKYISELNAPGLSLEERELCEGKLTLT